MFYLGRSPVHAREPVNDELSKFGEGKRCLYILPVVTGNNSKEEKQMVKRYTLLLLGLALTGCGHAQTTKIGLMSFGNLEGKTISDSISGQRLSGKACGHNYRLSDAVRDALKDTEFDTLINVDVTNETGLFVWNNCLMVSGNALNSKSIVASGGAK